MFIRGLFRGLSENLGGAIEVHGDSQSIFEHFLDAEKCARTVHDRAGMANI